MAERENNIKNYEPGFRLGYPLTLDRIDTTDASVGQVIIFDGATPVWGAGGSGSPSLPFNSIQYNNAGTFYGDLGATRDPSNFETSIGRTFESTNYEYIIEVGDLLVIGNAVGTFQVGETVTDGTSGATGVVEVIEPLDNPNEYVLILSGVAGTFANPNTITGGTSGATAQVGQFFGVGFNTGDIFSYSPILGTPEGTGLLTDVTGYTYTATNVTGTMTVGYFMVDNPGSPTKYAGIISFVQNPIITEINSRMFSSPDVSGGSNVPGIIFSHSDMAGNSAFNGIVDFSSFGGTPFTSAMFANNISGDSANLFIGPGQGSILSENSNNDSFAFVFQPTFFSVGITRNSSDEFGFQSDGTTIGWRKGNFEFNLPTVSPSSSNEFMKVDSIVGNSINLGWAVPAGGGGSPGGSQYDIQINDGSGGFTGDSSFQWNYSSDIPYFAGQNGLSVVTTEFGESVFGYFGPNIDSKSNYIEITNSTQQYRYVSYADIFSAIGFTGTGVNDLIYQNTNGYNGPSSTSWTITVDSPIGQFSGILFTGTGLQDLNTVSGFSGAFQPFTSYSIVIDGVNVDYIDYTNRVGSFSPGQTITDSITGATATVVYDNGDILLISGIAGGTFDPGDSFDNGLGDSADVVTTGVTDTFTWLDSDANTASNVIITGAAQTLSYSTQITFGSTTGHTLNDNWNFFYGQGYARFNAVPTSMLGTFQTGETVTGGTSGATGIAVRGDLFSLYDQLYLTNIGGTFRSGETVTGGTSGATAVLDDTFGGFGDTVTWTDGTTTENQVGIMDTGMMLSYFVSVIWGDPDNHVIGDVWNFSVNRNLSIKQEFAGANYVVGDISSVYNTLGDKLNINSMNGSSVFNVNTLFSITNGNNYELFRMNMSNSNPNANTIIIGDGNNYFGGLNAYIAPYDGVFLVRGASNVEYLRIYPGQNVYDMGDISNANNNSYIRVDDGAMEFTVALNSSVELSIDKTNGTARFGGVNTNESYLDIDDVNRILKIGSINNQGTEIEMDSDDGIITYTGGKAETSIRTLAYGSSHGLNLDDYILKFSGSTGAATVLLDSVAFRTGQLLVIKDYDCIASTSNITLDSGTGNIISGSTQAQTYVMSTDGQCVYVRHMGGGDWQIE